MSIIVQWDNTEKTAIRYDYQSEWTWDELYKAIDEANHLLDTVDHKVACIINMQHSRLLPKNAMSQVKNVNKKAHPNLEFNVTVGAPTLVRSLADMFTRIYGKLSDREMPYFVATLDEARALIAKRQTKVLESVQLNSQ